MPKELQAFIDIRNIIIHQGLPIMGVVSEEEYDIASRDMWQRVKRAVSLFEKSLLHILDLIKVYFEEGFDECRQYSLSGCIRTDIS